MFTSKISIFNIFLFFLILFFPFLIYGATVSRPPTNLGLVGYWPMDEGSGLAAGDASGNGNNGTLTGTTWVNGKHGKALSFDGSTNKVIISNSSSLNISGSTITVSVWFKASNLSGKKILLTKGSYGYHWNYGIGFDNYNLMFRHDNGDITSTAVSVSLNTWHNFTGVYSGGNNYYYFDGVLIDTKSDQGWSEQLGDKQLTIGAAYTLNSGIYSEFFSGLIDDIRIYNRALSQTEISKLYSSGQVSRKQVSNSGLVGYWSMNEGSGTKISDSSGNGVGGTITGATWVNGKRGKALSFDGISNKVSGGDVTVGQFMTISAWIKKNTSTGQKSFFSNRGGVGAVYFGLQQDRIFFYNNSGGPSPVLSNFGALKIGEWQHVVGTSDGSTTIFYVNGEEVFSAPQTRFSSTGTFGIGWDPGLGNEYWDGEIDDVRVYSRTLSPVEVKNLYKQTEVKINSSQNDKITDGLVGLWSFNGQDISGSTAYDRSGHGNDGTITGAQKTIGKVGQGLDFPVTGNRCVTKSNPIGMNFTTEFTLSVWIKTTDTSGKIVGRWNGVQWNHMLTVGENSSDGKVRIVIDKDGGPGSYDVRRASVAAINDDKWHHVVGVYNGSGGVLDLYVDGVASTDPLVGSVPTSIISSSQPFDVGGSDAGCTQRLFNGSIDEVRVYSRALDSNEIKQLYNLGR